LPGNAYGQFLLSYVLRHGGVVEQSGTLFENYIALERGNYLFRSCAWSFLWLGQPQRAMDFVRLDAGSEWAARSSAYILLREGKLAEARQSIQKASANPLMARDLLQSCLDHSPTSVLDRIAKKTEAAALAQPDGEPRYHLGS